MPLHLIALAAPAFHAVGAHLGALLASHAGTAIATATVHHGVSTAVSQTLPHVLAHMSSQHLAMGSLNYASATLTNAAAASSGLAATCIIGSGAFGAVSLFNSISDIRAGGHGNSTLGKIAKFAKKFPWTKLGKGQNGNEDTKLLTAIFILVFIGLDQIYETLGNRAPNSEKKTRLEQVQKCTGCTSCVDFDLDRKRVGRYCRCGCLDNSHQEKTSWEDNFLRHGIGFLILLSVATGGYKSLERVGINSDDTIYTKKDLSDDIEKCTECGCTDFTLIPPWKPSYARKCVCGHNPTEHKQVRWNTDDESDTPEMFMTSLAVLMDLIYVDMGHKLIFTTPNAPGTNTYKKISIFQIKQCRRKDCLDFNYKSNTTLAGDPREVVAQAFCHCGEREAYHVKPDY